MHCSIHIFLRFTRSTTWPSTSPPKPLARRRRRRRTTATTSRRRRRRRWRFRYQNRTGRRRLSKEGSPMADSNKSSPLLPADSFMGALVGNEDQHMICVTPYSVKMSCSGIWDAEDSILLHNIPRSLIQIFLIAAISRLLHFLLRPLKQPRIVCDIAVSNNILNNIKQSLFSYKLSPLRTVFLYF